QDRSGHSHIFFERLRLVDLHIRPFGREALIGVHISLRHARTLRFDERDRVTRIADILVVAGLLVRRLERERPAALKEERLRLRILWWPCLVAPPYIRSSFKDQRARQLRVSGIL